MQLLIIKVIINSNDCFSRIGGAEWGYTMSKCQKIMLKMSKMSKKTLKCQKGKYAKNGEDYK